jgi:hypothetical protein
MTYLALLHFGPNEMAGNPNFGMWMFLTISAVVFFGIFIPVATYMDSRRKEREAFYKAETFRRLVESSGEGAKAAVTLLREEDRLKRIKVLEGMKIGGLSNLCVGIGLTIFLRLMLGGGQGSPYLCGLIPGFIGVAMLVYVYVLAVPVE